MLPGDSIDAHATSGDLYLVSGNDVTFVRDRVTGFLFDTLGDNPTDAAYFGYDARADINGDGSVTGADVTRARNRGRIFHP